MNQSTRHLRRTGGRWRRSMLLVGAVVTALVLSSCGSDSDSTGTTAGTTAAAGGSTSGEMGESSAPTAAPGGNLVVGMTSDPDTLFPWKATQFQAVNILGLAYGSLTELDKDLAVVPGLAASWEYNDDATELTMTLQEGVTFADGSPLTSADVEYSLTAIQDEATAAVARSTLTSVTGIAAPDDQTVVLTLSGPDAGLLAGLATVNLAILKKGDNEESLTATTNGTGPFVFGSRKPSESLILNANPIYWRGAPTLGSVEFRIIPDETSIVAALQSGNVQMATIDDPLVAQTAEATGIAIAKTSQLSYHALQLNASKAPLDDVNVRLAIACAIDRQQVIDTAALGEGEVTGPITSPAFKSDPNAGPCANKDLAKSKEYLAKSAYADGLTIKTIVSQGEYSTSVNEAQNLAAQLAEAGITMELEVLESGAYVDRWVAADFETAVALNGGRPDPDTMYGRYFTSTGNLNKVAGYSSPELDKLFAAGKASTDPAERATIYTDVSNNLVDNAAWVWLFTGFTYTATTTAVAGFTPMATGSLQYLRETTVS